VLNKHVLYNMFAPVYFQNSGSGLNRICLRKLGGPAGYVLAQPEWGPEAAGVDCQADVRLYNICKCNQNGQGFVWKKGFKFAHYVV
jgi:hypothetical protein